MYENGLLREKKVAVEEDQNLNKQLLEQYRNTQRSYQTQQSSSRVECQVCSTEMEEMEEVYELSCGDKVHQICLLSWLTMNDNCPLCLGKLKAEERKELEMLLNESYI